MSGKTGRGRGNGVTIVNAPILPTDAISIAATVPTNIRDTGKLVIGVNVP